jgi:murein DD-endopeptidase MepM/ murein hydrolase activator NlpD
LPDARRWPLAGLNQPRLVTRAFAHLTVVGLVVTASAIGISRASANQDRTAFPLVGTAHGAAAQAATLPTSTTYEIIPQPEVDAQLVSRAVPASAPDSAAPKPTPVPVDPNAAPLPAPTAAPAAGVPSAPPPAAPVAASSGALAWPVPGGSVSQYYHAGHLAIDVAAPYGSQVVAANGGVVTSAGWRNNGGGLVVEIDHGNGFVTVYNHLGSIWVSPGQAVGRGQGIAGVGCTGICTGPHVHFEVIVNGVISNPLRYL